MWYTDRILNILFWDLLVIVERSFSWLKTEVCPDTRAQENLLAKFPIKMKVEDLVVYVTLQNSGVDVAAGVEIIPQTLRSPIIPFLSDAHLSPRLWAQKRPYGALGRYRMPLAPSPPPLQASLGACPLPHTLPYWQLSNPAHRPVPPTADVARKRKWKSVFV